MTEIAGPVGDGCAAERRPERAHAPHQCTAVLQREGIPSFFGCVVTVDDEHVLAFFLNNSVQREFPCL